MNCISVESLVCDHDIIEIGPEFLEQKGNVLFVVQLAMCSTLGVYNIGPRQPVTCSKLPVIFALFPVLSLRVHPHAIKVILSLFYFGQCSRGEKYQALSACTTLMFTFRSVGAWEQGYVKYEQFAAFVVMTQLLAYCGSKDRRFIGH